MKSKISVSFLLLSPAVENMDTLPTEDTQIQADEETHSLSITIEASQTEFVKKTRQAQDIEETEPLTLNGKYISL